MDILDDKLVVAMGNRHIYIYDVRNMSETLQKRESSLKYMTRAIACLPTKDGKDIIRPSYCFALHINRLLF
jgi:cell cycle arrest protein BUB3